uniref:Uncharacterized protein n=1 Tax=Siphoviridae sp. ct7Qv4 TaxID=2827786 RepID=A0A8S5SMN7_9CAUD|nr:MAG TPA: hypothetical protein [Siphoviridae sp. ct7Qv4]
MAFSRDKLVCYANNARTGVVPALWLYDNTAGDTVTEAGFIKDHRIAKNDVVTVITTSDHKKADYYVSAVTNGAATLVAVPA